MIIIIESDNLNHRRHSAGVLVGITIILQPSPPSFLPSFPPSFSNAGKVCLVSPLLYTPYYWHQLIKQLDRSFRWKHRTLRTSVLRRHGHFLTPLSDCFKLENNDAFQ